MTEEYDIIQQSMNRNMVVPNESMAYQSGAGHDALMGWIRLEAAGLKESEKSTHQFAAAGHLEELIRS